MNKAEMMSGRMTLEQFVEATGIGFAVEQVPMPPELASIKHDHPEATVLSLVVWMRGHRETYHLMVYEHHREHANRCFIDYLRGVTEAVANSTLELYAAHMRHLPPELAKLSYDGNMKRAIALREMLWSGYGEAWIAVVQQVVNNYE